MVKLGNDWDELLQGEWEKPYYRKLREFLKSEYRKETIYPPAEDIFNALKYTSYEDTKVVILGQDPYHEPGEAQGLAFSVSGDVKLPPSLVNIFKELEDDIGPGACEGVNRAGSEPVLKPWAEQGVMLLNTVLTVRAHQAESHKGRGWEQFTDRVIELLAARSKPMVFVLWGAKAIAKKPLIEEASRRSAGSAAAAKSGAAQAAQPTGTAEFSDPTAQPADAAEFSDPTSRPDDPAAAADTAAASSNSAQAAAMRHLIITAPHPSPLSAYRGFFGGRYFSRCNYFLEDNGIAPIDWRL